jgi:cobalt-zinc-cadmium efflux system outer membrane protein
MFYRIITIIAISMLSSGPAFALTMEEAVTTGLRNNPEMQAFRFEEDAAKGQMQKAKLPPFSNPTIEGGLSLKERPQAEPGGKFRNNQISLSQSVEVAGQRGLRIDVATHNLERARMEIHDLERKLRADIRDKFAEVLFLRDKETLAKQFARLQEELSRLVSVKYEAGDVAALEVNLSQVELARARRDLIAASTEYKNALLSLKTLIGMASDAEVILEGDLAADLPPLPDRETLLNRISARPDIKAAEAEIQRSEAALRLAKRELIPNVTWSLFQERDEQRYERGLTLSVEIPLFDRKQAERTEARAKVSQARIREAGVARTARKEIEESYAAAASSLSELDLFKQAILGRTTENLDLLQYAFQEGKISFYDVRVAQREMIETRNAYLQTLLTAQRSYNTLERAIGGDLR